jgi:hypothetical protein
MYTVYTIPVDADAYRDTAKDLRGHVIRCEDVRQCL